MPDFIHILLNGSVGCKFAGTSHIENCALSPAGCIPVSRFHFLLRLCIGLEILQDEISIRLVGGQGIQQGIIQRTEQLLVCGIGSVNQLCQHLVDIRIFLEYLHGIIPAMVLILNHLVRGQTEDKGILFSNLFHNLHICTVHGSQSQCTIEHELHIARTGSLLAGSGNLLPRR